MEGTDVVGHEVGEGEGSVLGMTVGDWEGLTVGDWELGAKENPSIKFSFCFWKKPCKCTACAADLAWVFALLQKQ